jgi:hypothetical protein
MNESQIGKNKTRKNSDWRMKLKARKTSTKKTRKKIKNQKNKDPNEK